MLRCSFALSLAREINSFPHRTEFDSPGRAGIWIFGIIFEKARLPQWLMSGKGCCGFGLGKSSVLSITELVKDFSGEHDLLSYLIFILFFFSEAIWTKLSSWIKLPYPNHHNHFTGSWVMGWLYFYVQVSSTVQVILF